MTGLRTAECDTILKLVIFLYCDITEDIELVIQLTFFVLPIMYNYFFGFNSICSYHSNERPLDHGGSHARDGAVAACDAEAQAVGKQESYPVEQESH